MNYEMEASRTNILSEVAKEGVITLKSLYAL